MRRGFILLAAALLAVCLSALAQDTARINGSVTDQTGAVIPNAKVTIENPARGFKQVLKSDSAGFFCSHGCPHRRLRNYGGSIRLREVGAHRHHS